MRYTSEHKAESRRRIVEAARQLFRLRGFDAASIDEIMNQAGLTRGAFYAHFDSKDDLVREVLSIEAGLVRQLQAAADVPDPRTTTLQALTAYLDPEQSNDVASGCPLVAHPVDAIRGSEERRQGYTERLHTLVASLQAIAGGDRDRAVHAAVLAVGGALLSSASADSRLSEEIGSICLDQISRTLAHS